MKKLLEFIKKIFWIFNCNSDNSTKGMIIEKNNVDQIQTKEADTFYETGKEEKARIENEAKKAGMERKAIEAKKAEENKKAEAIRKTKELKKAVVSRQAIKTKENIVKAAAPAEESAILEGSVSTIVDEKANIDEELKDIFSEWNYGKINGRTHLTLKTLDPKYIEYTLGMIKKLPKTPAIYFYKQNDEVVYVGKAINLRKRTCEHFFDGNGADKVDEFLRENPEEYSISFIDCNIDDLSDWERREIKKFNPKHNYNTGGGKITAKYTRTVANMSEIGNIVSHINADGMIFTVSGRFSDDDGMEISRTVITSIVKELGGIFSPKGSLKTELTIAGRKPGAKALKGRADRKAVIHPFHIKGFKEIYYKRG